MVSSRLSLYWGTVKIFENSWQKENQYKGIFYFKFCFHQNCIAGVITYKITWKLILFFLFDSFLNNKTKKIFEEQSYFKAAYHDEWHSLDETELLNVSEII